MLDFLPIPLPEALPSEAMTFIHLLLFTEEQRSNIMEMSVTTEVDDLVGGGGGGKKLVLKN